MENFFRKIGLIIDHRIELPVQKNWFVSILQENVEQGSLFEAFSSSKAVFKGIVDRNGFELRQRRKLFRRRNNPTKANGVFSQLGDTLRIDVEITGYHWTLIIYYLFVIAFFGIFFGLFLFGNAFDGSGPPHPIILLFLFFQAGLMVFLPYFLLKSAVRQMKEELEREFYYLVQKHENTV